MAARTLFFLPGWAGCFFLSFFRGGRILPLLSLSPPPLPIHLSCFSFSPSCSNWAVRRHFLPPFHSYTPSSPALIASYTKSLDAISHLICNSSSVGKHAKSLLYRSSCDVRSRASRTRSRRPLKSRRFGEGD